MRFDRHLRFHLFRGFPIILPRLFPDAVSVFIQNERSFITLELDGPAVIVRITIIQRPGGHEIWVLEYRTKLVGSFRADHFFDTPIAHGRSRRARIGEPLHHVHEMSALVGHISAGIIPEIAPVAETHGLQLAILGRTEKPLPIELAFERRIVELLGDVPVPLRLHHADAAQDAAVHQLLGFDDGFGAAPLHAHLHNLFGLAHGVYNLAALFKRVRHGFFKVHVLLGIERCLKARIMLVIGRGDDDRVNPVLMQQVVIIEIALGPCRVLQGHLNIRFVDIAHSYALRAKLLKIAVQITPPAAGANQAVRQTLICSPRGS